MGKKQKRGKIYISRSPVFQRMAWKVLNVFMLNNNKKKQKIITSPLGRKSERSEFKRQLLTRLLDLGHHSDLGHVSWPVWVHFPARPVKQRRRCDIKGQQGLRPLAPARPRLPVNCRLYTHSPRLGRYWGRVRGFLLWQFKASKNKRLKGAPNLDVLQGSQGL